MCATWSELIFAFCCSAFKAQQHFALKLLKCDRIAEICLKDQIAAIQRWSGFFQSCIKSIVQQVGFFFINVWRSFKQPNTPEQKKLVELLYLKHYTLVISFTSWTLFNGLAPGGMKVRLHWMPPSKNQEELVGVHRSKCFSEL